MIDLGSTVPSTTPTPLPSSLPPILHLDLDSVSTQLDTLWLDDLLLLSHLDSTTTAGKVVPPQQQQQHQQQPQAASVPSDPIVIAIDPRVAHNSFSANQEPAPIATSNDSKLNKCHGVPSAATAPTGSPLPTPSPTSSSSSSLQFSHSHSHSHSLTEPLSVPVPDSFLSLRPSPSSSSSHAGRDTPDKHSKTTKSQPSRSTSTSPAALFLLHRSSRLLAKIRKHLPNPAATCTPPPLDSPVLVKTAPTAASPVFLPTRTPPPSTPSPSAGTSSKASKRKSAPPALSLPPLPRHPSPSSAPSAALATEPIPATPLAPRPNSATVAAMESPHGLPRLDLSSLPYHGGHNSSDSDSSSPSSPGNSAAGSPTKSPSSGKRRGSKVQFSRYIKVSYTFAAEEYDRNPVEPPAMTAKDYYEYQVMAFEMHQAIRFETTMRQLGLWDNATPGIAQVPVVPTIPVVASTLERRKEVKSTFSKGTKVVVAKPRTTSLQAQMLDLDAADTDGLPVVTLGSPEDVDDDDFVQQLEAHTLTLVDEAALDDQLADYERHYAALAAAGYPSSAPAPAIRT